MDDYRIVWFKERVYHYLAIKEEDIFSDFIKREDGKYAKELREQLDGESSKHAPAILFYLGEREVEVEVEVVEGIKFVWQFQFDRNSLEDEGRGCVLTQLTGVTCYK